MEIPLTRVLCNSIHMGLRCFYQFSKRQHIEKVSIFSTFQMLSSVPFSIYSHRTSHIIDLYSNSSTEIKIVYLRCRYQAVIILHFIVSIFSLSHDELKIMCWFISSVEWICFKFTHQCSLSTIIEEHFGWCLYDVYFLVFFLSHLNLICEVFKFWKRVLDLSCPHFLPLLTVDQKKFTEICWFLSNWFDYWISFDLKYFFLWTSNICASLKVPSKDENSWWEEIMPVLLMNLWCFWTKYYFLKNLCLKRTFSSNFDIFTRIVKFWIIYSSQCKNLSKFKNISSTFNFPNISNYRPAFFNS